MSADPESRGATSGHDPAADVPTGPGGDEPGAAESGASPAEFEPDVRFTYANERTFLAWNRTALALIATGVAATQLLPEFHVAYGRRILGVPLIALGALVAVTSFRQWRANERAMRLRRPLPTSSMTTVLSIGIAVVAVVAVVLVLLGTK
jgi:putative membrane protein